MPETEQWRNQTAGTAFVLKFDRFHNLESQLVTAGHIVTISKEEREINQEKAASDSLDIFKNGILIPIKVVDPEDEREFAENPNLMSEEDLKNLLRLPKAAFKVRLKEISNLYPLSRLQELANADDAKVTTGVVQVLEERIAELSPEPARMKSFADEKP